MLLNWFQKQFLYWMVWMLPGMHQWNNYFARTQVPCSCPTYNYLAEKDEMAAAQKNIEAGDLLGKSWDCLLFLGLLQTSAFILY